MGIITLFINKTYLNGLGAEPHMTNNGGARGVAATRGNAARRTSARGAQCGFAPRKQHGAWAIIVKCPRHRAVSRALAEEDQGRREPGMTKAGIWKADWFLGVAVVDTDISL